MNDREAFLWQRSVEISAFEAMSEEEDARLWEEALRAADVLFGPEPEESAPTAAAERVQEALSG